MLPLPDLKIHSHGGWGFLSLILSKKHVFKFKNKPSTSPKLFVPMVTSNSSHRGNKPINSEQKHGLNLPKGEVTLAASGYQNAKLHYSCLKQEVACSSFLCSHLFCKISVQLWELIGKRKAGCNTFVRLKYQTGVIWLSFTVSSAHSVGKHGCTQLQKRKSCHFYPQPPLLKKKTSLSNYEHTSSQMSPCFELPVSARL